MSAFRRALANLADDAGPGDADRAAAIRARAHALTARRRAAVAVTAVLAVALAVAAVAGTVAGLPAGGRASLLPEPPAAEGTPTVTETASATVTPTPAASPTTEGPAPTAPEQVASTAAASTAAASKEPTVTIRVAKAGGTSAETELEVRVRDPLGSVTALRFSFGVDDPRHVDHSFPRYFPGAGVLNENGEMDAVVNRCATAAERAADHSAPADETFRFRRTFRFPGTYTAYAQVRTRSCLGVDSEDGQIREGAVNPVVESTLRYGVTGGAWPNGPARPTVELAFRRDHWEPPDAVDDGPGLQVREYDADGALGRVRVDWGDGTVEDVAFGADPTRDVGAHTDCREADEFAPAGQENYARPDHTYAQPGTYTVTVTVTTASCDGSRAQTATTSGTWDWPPPSASPTDGTGATP